MNNLSSVLCLIIFAFWAGCAPKTKTIIEAPEVVVEKPDYKTLTCAQLDDLPPYERELAETGFVLYKNFLGQKDYKQAMSYWKNAYNLAPGSNGSVKSHFDDGVTLYAQLLNDTKEPSLKSKYMDTISQIYAKREKCFGGDAYYYGQKGFAYYYQLKEYVTEQQIYDAFTKSIEAGNGKIEYFIINPFTKIIYDMVNAGTINNDEASGYAIKIKNTIIQGLNNCKGQDCDSWNIINEYAPNLLESFEGIEGFYDCSYYSEKYYKLFNENPDDCDNINSAYAKLVGAKCPENQPELIAIKAAKDQKCYVAPPPPGTLRQAYDAYTNGQFNDAVTLFQTFVNETDDAEKKSKYLLLIAKIYYGDIKNFPKARQAALEAAKYKPNWGDPYILIGKLYASSGPLCGPGRGWDSQIVTWPAIDKFQYAKKIDPSVSQEAQKWINTYQKYMPSNEDIFFRQIKAGSSYFVPCWIQESTTVRTAD